MNTERCPPPDGSGGHENEDEGARMNGRVAPRLLQQARPIDVRSVLPPDEITEPEPLTRRSLVGAVRESVALVRLFDAVRGSPLKFMVLADCMALAFSKGNYVTSDREAIYELARALDIDAEQACALEEWVRHRKVGPVAAPRLDAGLATYFEVLTERMSDANIPIDVLAAVSEARLAGASSWVTADALIASGFGTPYRRSF